jgi:hypothetical protein
MSEHDPLNTESVDRARKDSATRDRLAQQNEAEDVKWLMSSKRGRRIIWRMLDRAGVYRLSFNTNSMSMAFAEGARNEGLRLISLVHRHCADLYPTMLKEANEAP